MKKIIGILALVLLTSCSNSFSYFNREPQVAYIENDNVSVQLALAAKKASEAIIELAEVEKVRTPTTVAPIVENAPRLLRQPMSITWNGPLNTIAEKIADRAMYGFVELGSPSPVAILVQVDAIETPLVDILRNISLQAGSRANIVVDIENRNIEVHYAEIEQML